MSEHGVNSRTRPQLRSGAVEAQDDVAPRHRIHRTGRPRLGPLANPGARIARRQVYVRHLARYVYVHVGPVGLSVIKLARVHKFDRVVACGINE